MSTKLITYNRRPGRNDSAMVDAVRSLGAWWHHLDSTWLVQSDLTVTQLREHLGSYLDADDKLLVVDVAGDHRAWRGFSEGGTAWLKDTWD